ncbi:MAG: hypothetical protein A2Z34_01445 [Planctomycetes bacterium RBG_16_59_8]|nr:MAG: hypothetical protein A2Z34_01445 [Planctomycetes bacterium RBG_16_59_8]
MIVLDASVVLKWFLDEEDSGVALGYLDDYCSGRESIAVPSLLPIEVANALVCNPKIPQEEIEGALQRLGELRLAVCELGIEELQRSVALARRHKITAYDACYLIVAEKLKCDMVTADRKLIQRIPDLRYARLLTVAE